MEIISKVPSECNSFEIETFKNYLLHANEVVANGLFDRIINAHVLIFLVEGICIKGIAGIKNPSNHYKNSVFVKAQVPFLANKYKYEIGWVFLLPVFRNKGYSNVLIDNCLRACNSEGVYATSRVNNIPMHRALLSHGFNISGEQYSNGDNQFYLFVNDNLFKC